MSAHLRFPGQRATEEICIVVRHHWIFDAAVVARVLLMAFPPLLLIPIFRVLKIDVAHETMLLALLLYAFYLAFLLVRQFQTWINTYLDFAVITNERLLDFTQISIMNQKVAETPLGVVQDATGQINGFWGTVLHFGDVVVQTAGEAENFEMMHVRHPNQVASRIMELRENYIAKRIEAGFPPLNAIGEPLSTRPPKV